MDRRAFLAGSIGLLVAPVAAEAQQPATMPTIGLLRIGHSSDDQPDPFRNALHELGYTEGKNIRIESRWAEGRLDRLSPLAIELARLKVDVLVAGGVAGVRAAQQATTTIPIVMEAATDPVGAGLIVSLAHPGGHITGSATLASELGSKRLELFTEAFPSLTRMAILSDPATSASVLRDVETAARVLNLSLRVLDVQVPEALRGAFIEATQWRADAVFVLASPFFLSERGRIATLALAHRLPTSVAHRAYVEAGGLIAYGPDFRDLRRRAAVFVDKILKGAKPADLPVEQPTKFELIINLKTAKALGLTIPPSVLARADEVIQ